MQTISHPTITESYMKHLVDELASFYKITVVYHFKSSCGRAHMNKRKILIPAKIDTVDKMLVAFHEICHIVQGEIKPRFKEEYMAEQYAITYAKSKGYNTDDYEMRAKCHVTRKIAEAYNRGFKIQKLPDDIRNWLCDVVDFTEWEQQVNSRTMVWWNKNIKSIVVQHKPKEASTRTVSISSATSKWIKLYTLNHDIPLMYYMENMVGIEKYITETGFARVYSTDEATHKIEVYPDAQFIESDKLLTIWLTKP